ncbi:MAG: hypothetical protein HOP29_09760 [Phycisphaerales bacterium]|nr:hypothetical protein [Phycisphaerales bacterium]
MNEPIPAGLRRDLPALAERVLIIGLDGATFDILTPMMDAGRMPNLRAFVERGVCGALESTRPPITPAAWTTFMTGKTPGTHGVIDFERYDPHTDRLSFNSVQSVGHVRNIWRMLGDKGLRVGVINVPMTYPPRPVNGFLITGFETPGTDVEFTHPPGLKDDILTRWPGYTFKTTWKRTTWRGARAFADNLKRICDSFHNGVEVTRFCGDRYGWDALMIVFKLVDNLQHKTWKYLDPRWRDDDPRRAAMVADCFNELDVALGGLFEYAESNRAHVFIMSDHGHGSLEGKIQPNLMLKEWGYLHLETGGAQSRTRAAGIFRRAFGRKKGKFATHQQIDGELAVDFGRTRACVMHAGMYGFLYLNLKGRQPTGIVDQADYESLRDELRGRFLSAGISDAAGRPIKAFTHAFKPEELYGCSRVGREWMPDLLLAPIDGLAVVRKIRGSRPVRWFGPRKIEGTHRLDGMFAMAGDGVVRGVTRRERIIDATPTMLAMLGLRIPDDLEGRVMTDLFDRPIQFEHESAERATAVAAGGDVYSEREQQVLTERLADLGYLE